MNYKRLLIIVIIILGVAFFLPKKHKNFDLKNLPKFEVGDLIFRYGDVLDSYIIAQKSNFKYSHVGVIVSLEPTLIIHATTDDIKNKKNQVILSTFDEFLSHALNFGVARINFLTKNQKEKLASSLQKRIGEEFILSSKDEINLYCTTLIEQEISKLIKFSPKYTYIDTPFFKGEYLFPAQFWDYEGISIVYENK